MIQIKKLKRPTKLSGEVSELKKFGVRIVNVSKETLYVDSVKSKRK